MFCATTGAIVTGAIAERGRLVPMMVFIFFWATLVYCPIACWVWNINGWAFKLGVLDYAGGECRPIFFPNKKTDNGRWTCRNLFGRLSTSL
jgi:ammonia channel protein AmtB